MDVCTGQLQGTVCVSSQDDPKLACVEGECSVDGTVQLGLPCLGESVSESDCTCADRVCKQVIFQEILSDLYKKVAAISGFVRHYTAVRRSLLDVCSCVSPVVSSALDFPSDASYLSYVLFRSIWCFLIVIVKNRTHLYSIICVWSIRVESFPSVFTYLLSYYFLV